MLFIYTNCHFKVIGNKTADLWQTFISPIFRTLKSYDIVRHKFETKNDKPTFLTYISSVRSLTWNNILVVGFKFIIQIPIRPWRERVVGTYIKRLCSIYWSNLQETHCPIKEPKHLRLSFFLMTMLRGVG